MAIFNKDPDNIRSEDVAELLTDSAVENVQLEFKREVPGKDETLKKLASLGNTFGGYLVVGAAANSDGVLTAIPGVNAQPNYKQTIIQWCYEGITPPLQPLVSPPIPAGDSDDVCYVIYVPMSADAPHFINARKGCYVRTNEFSHRFEPRLATYREIQHLAERRSAAIQRREQVSMRAQERLNTYIQLDYASTPNVEGPIGATLLLYFAPVYPPLITTGASTIDEASLAASLTAWGSEFPLHRHERIHQFESVIFRRAGGLFSYLETGALPSVFYASEIEEIRPKEDGSKVNVVYLGHVASHVLVLTRYAGRFFSALGYKGPVNMDVELRNIRRVPFLKPRIRNHFYDPWSRNPESVLDDAVKFSVATDTTELTSTPDAPSAQCFSVLLQSINLPDDGEWTDRVLRAGYDYCHWK